VGQSRQPEPCASEMMWMTWAWVAAVTLSLVAWLFFTIEYYALYYDYIKSGDWDRLDLRVLVVGLCWAFAIIFVSRKRLRYKAPFIFVSFLIMGIVAAVLPPLEYVSIFLNYVPRLLGYKQFPALPLGLFGEVFVSVLVFRAGLKEHPRAILSRQTAVLVSTALAIGIIFKVLGLLALPHVGITRSIAACSPCM